MKETDVRRHMLEALEADLVGPFVPDSHPQGGQEILPIAPSRWYLTGFLAPQGGRAPDPDDEDSVDGGLTAGSESQAEDVGTDEPEPKRPVRFPASMGMSVFLPAGKDDTIDVDVWYADYDKIELALEHSERKVPGWKRVPHGPVRVAVPLDAKKIGARGGILIPGSRNLILKGELRTTAMDGLPTGTRVLSLFLVNDRTVIERDRGATANRLKDVHQTLSDYTSGRTDSPFPLTTCPWCGAPIKIQNIKLVDREGNPTKKNFARAAVYCEQSSCLPCRPVAGAG